MSPGGLTRALDRLLPFWFLAWALVRLGLLQGFASLTATPGLDFRIYRAGGAALLSGVDPWHASVAVGAGDPAHFAALPIAAQAFVPFALLPADIGFVVWTVASVTLSVLVLRRLELPLWWLLFPPLVEGLVAGNPQIALLGLLVLGGARRAVSDGMGPAPAAWGRRKGAPLTRALTDLARVLAVSLKVYAFAPVIARREWRAVGLVLAVFGLSVALAPGLWQSYIEQFGAISTRLGVEARGGTSAAALITPGFGPGGLVGTGLFAAAALLVVAVAIRDTAAAGWLAAPLLWPAAEYHYATFALPIARRFGVLVMAMAVPNAALAGIVILAASLVLRPRLVDDGAPVVGLASWLRALRPTWNRGSAAPGETRPRPAPRARPAGPTPT